MARLLSQKGVTATTTIGSPTEGMKWIVKWAMIVLHTGTGTGTRGVDIMISRGNIDSAVGPHLASCDNQTGTSSIFYSVGDVTSYINFNSVTFYQYPEVFAVDTIQLLTGLISGDTVDYYILVEEATS